MEEKMEGENPENEKRIARIKRHLKENKKVYLVGGGCLVAGYFLRRPRVIMIAKDAAPTIAPVFNNVPVFNNTVNNGGHMRKIVKCLDTGDLWLSVTDAAKAQAKSISLMSQHLNHPEIVSDINGLTFVIEALATS